MRSFILLAFGLVASVAAQNQAELCDVNACPNGNTCFKRPNPPDGEADYVCECSSPFGMGFDCSTPSDNLQVVTSYGTSGVEYFQSPNYDSNYSDRARVLYLLFIPGATEITFSFDSPFGIEANKDELYIGKGLAFDFSQLDGVNDPDNDKFFFEGREVPDSFTIESDAVWMYFLTDKNNNDMIYEGFRVRWALPQSDTTPPVVQGCPANIVRQIALGLTGSGTTWVEPTATDDSGVVILSTRSHAPGFSFPIGTTQVQYVFADGSGNTASCLFNVVVVAVDSTPPSIVGIADIFRQVPFGSGGTTVTWTEPSASDNSGSVTLQSRSATPGQFFAIGTTTVTYTFRDPSGNTASTSFNVVVSEEAELCDVNACPNGNTCFKRPNPPDGEADYVCECSSPFGMGFDCSTPSDNLQVVTSYGTSGVEYFQSPNYDSNYSDRARVLYLLFIPGATEITFSFDSPFGIEANKDELYIGKGLAFDFSQLDGVNDPDNDKFFFEGREVPDSFTIESDAVWMYFLTDKNNNDMIYEGFRVRWALPSDTTPPVVQGCPANIVRQIALGLTGSGTTWVEPTATDDSGVVILSLRSHAPGFSFPIGTTQVQYVFADGSGNTASCLFNVVVVAVDSTPPSIVGIADIFRQVPFGSGGTTVTWTEPSASDNSGSVTLQSRSATPGQFFAIGTTTVTYTFRDPSGNTASTSFNVVVSEVDDAPPVVEQLPDVIVTVELGTATATVATWNEPSATDDSGIVTLVSRTRSPGSFFPLGSTPVTYTFEDPNGNQASTTFNVIVQTVDTTPPVITPLDNIVVTIPSPQTSTNVNWQEPGATDNSGTATLSGRTNAPNSVFPLGSTQVTYTFTDPSGNTATETFTVTVLQDQSDVTPPSVVQPQDTTVTVPLGSPGTTVDFTEPTATDNSGTVSLLSQTRQPGQFFPVGTTPVTYTYTDPSGNTASVTFNVNVVEVDTVPPTVFQPQDTTVTVPTGSPGTTVDFTEPTATDNSGTVSLLSQTRQPGQFFPVGTTPVTYTYTDPSGNTASVTFNVNVIEVDTLPPVIVQPQDTTVTVPLGSPGTTVDFTEPTATDNSGVVTLQSRTRAPGNFFQVGTTPVTYSYVDPSGNTASVTFNVNVIEVDSESPSIVQPEDITIYIPIGDPGSNVDFPEPTVTDDSGNPILLSRTGQPGQYFPVGSTPVTYTYTDPSGNTASVTFNVSVVPDVELPTIIQPEDIIIQAGVNEPGTNVDFPDPVVTDNSGNPILLTRTGEPGQYFPVGTTPVTYTDTDPSGNTASVTFDVTVLPDDDQPPTVQPEDTTVVIPIGQPGTNVDFTEPTATDNLGDVTLVSRTRQPGQFFPVGTTPVTYTYTDPSGNNATVTFNVNVVPDVELPIIIQPEDIVIQAGVNEPGSNVDFPDPVVTDNSGNPILLTRTGEPGDYFPVGTTPVTYTYTDPSGNTASVTFDVTVLPDDDQPPTVQPEDTTVTVPLGQPGTNVDFTEPTATDNLGDVTLVSRTRAPGNFFPVGTTPVTYTYTDPSGNTASVIFNVNVIEVDATAPVIENCEDFAATVGLNIGGVVVQFTEPTATDNSGTVTLVSRTRSPGQFFVVGSTPVTYVFVDPSGNQEQCTFNVIVTEVDGTDPVIQNCDDVEVTIGLNLGGTVVQYVEPIAFDNSGAVELLVSRSATPGQFFVVGNTPVTYVFADPAGNSVSCTFNVLVTEVDGIAPVIEGCLEDFSETTPLNSGGRVVTFVAPTATDNSGIVTLASQSQFPGQFFLSGLTTVTYRFIDPSNNEAVCTFDITVIEVDGTSPVIENCEDFAATVGLNIGGVVVQFPEPTATDNSGVVNLASRTRSPGQFFVVGSTPVTYVFLDPSGNQEECTFNVIVTEVDGTSPITENCEDFAATVGLNIGGVVVQFTEPTATDNSGTVTLVSRTRSPGQFFVVGSTPVTYVFVDPSGNQEQCTFNVIVTEVDGTDPVIQNCNDVEEIIGLNLGGTVVQYVEPIAVDNSGAAELLVSRSATPGQFFVVGNTPVTYVFADPAGNTASCTFNVLVTEVDDVPPVVFCLDDITQTIPLNLGGITVSWIEPSATDNSGSVSLSSRSSAPGSFFATGATQVIYVFSDPSGNSETCIFNVVVNEVDGTPPVIEGCLEDFNETTPLNTGGRVVTFVAPTATDNSGIVTVASQSHFPGQFFVTGLTTVTYRFVDPTNNEAVCSFDVTVVEVDQTPPVIVCTEDITETTNLGSPGTTVTFVEPTATDNSGVVSLASRSHAPGQFFLVGNTAVTYRFVDRSGNSVLCTFGVNVVEVDTTPPVIQNCDDVGATVGLNIGGVIVQYSEPTAIDNSGVVNLASRTRSPGQFFIVGSTPVTYTFVDGSGNSESCTFNVIVTEVDEEAPVIICNEDISRIIPLNDGGVVVTYAEPTATDNSGTAILSSQNHAPGDFFPTGTTQVIYIFSDPSGNSATCIFFVNVEEVDGEDPVIQCLEDIIQTVPLNAGGTIVVYTEPTATDNSGIVTLSSRTHTPGSFFASGVTQVTYVFVDSSDNSATCSFNVIVNEVDSTIPLVACIADITEETDLGSPGAVVIWDEPTATDNSGVVSLSSRSHAPGQFFIVGRTDVTYVFVDASGNQADCVFGVNVVEVDRVPPVIQCTEDVIESIPLNRGAVQVQYTEPTATDNSGTVNLASRNRVPGSFFLVGDTEVTYTFVDPSGNTASCTFTVTVIEIDEVPPNVIGCPANIADFVPLGIPGKIMTWSEPSSNDNSGVSTVRSRTHMPGTFFLLGDTTVTYVFQDESDNTAECSFVVTLTDLDQNPPVVVCPLDIEMTILTGEAGITVDFSEPTATDDSGTANRVSFTHPSGAFFGVGSTTVTYSFGDPSGNVGSCSFLVVVNDANPCAVQPCLNGGVCVVESLTEYTCICPECFSGETCEIEQLACDNNNCANGAACAAVPGSCEDYTCECSDCFFGEYCEERSNPCDNNQCANGAECVPDPDDCTLYYCLCPACYEGQFCELSIDPCAFNLCENGAQCIPIENGGCTEYTCSCSGCFTGQFCEVERHACDRNPCANGGLCSPIEGSCSSYTCECQGCFTGYNCELFLANPCEDSPCQNGGQCNVIPGQCIAYSCSCPEGYGGVNCQSIVTQNINPCASYPCGNGGECLTLDSNNYICMCRDGYAGIDCQTTIASSPFYDSCSPIQGGQERCANGATCVNSYNSNSLFGTFANPQYTCVCEDGYTGINCQLTTTDNPELDVCNRLGRPLCENGGECHNAYHQYDGDVDYYCHCPVGFVGHNCETNYYDPCGSDPCQNGAQCSAFNTYYTCQCQANFIGINCERNANIDNIPPIVSGVPGSRYVFTDNVGAIVDWVAPTATDNSGTATLIRQTRAPNSFFTLGTTPVTYVFADPSNNAVTVTFFVTVLSSAQVADTEAPVISNCPDAVNVITAGDSAIAAWDIPTANDNSGHTPVHTSNFQPGATFPVGTTLVRYTFRDDSGNAAVCAFEVIVRQQGLVLDTTAPVISNCPESVAVSVAPGVQGTTASWTSPTATDDSGEIPSRTSTHLPGAFFPLGRTLVRYTFSDPFGNFAICEFFVTVSTEAVVVDNQAPEIVNCPGDLTVNAPAGATFAVVTWVSPSATDNSGVTPSVVADHFSGELYAVPSSTLVTYIFTDGSGNSAICRFTVNVVETDDGGDDVTAPVISGCPDDIAVTAASTFTFVEWVAPTATDESGAVTLETNYPQPSGFFSSSSGAPIEVSYTFSDEAGNTAVCAFTISISTGGPTDTTPPTIVGCPAGITVTAPAGATSTAVTWTAPTATDAGSSVTVTQDHAPGDLFAAGSTTLVSYTFSDAAGNTATCSFNVVVNTAVIVDTTPPSITGCPANLLLTAAAGEMSAVGTWVSPTATDNSGVAPAVSTNHFSGELFNVGTTQVTYTFEDEAGNQAICSFNVVVTAATPGNPCASNPCAPGQACYYTPTQYLCLGGRKRRDVSDEWELFQ